MKLVLAIVLVIIIGLFAGISNVSAWYGAGVSKNWPHSINGLSGKVISLNYRNLPNNYQTNEQIKITFEITNPDNNSKLIDQPLYLHIWRISSVNVDHEYSEDQLNISHQENLDTQELVNSFKVGDLVLKPGQSSRFDVEFRIAESGYYQFDLTDLETSEDYTAGRIYVAGFIRVLDNQSNINQVASATAQFKDCQANDQKLFSILVLVVTVLSIWRLSKSNLRKISKILGMMLTSVIAMGLLYWLLKICF